MKIVTSAIISCMLLCACSGPGKVQSDEVQPDTGQPQGSWRTVTAEEAKEIMSESESDYIILDVRTEDEYNAGHIKDAILIPHDEISSLADSVLHDHDAIIFVYCRSGARSARAAETLAGMGFTNVYDMGGIIDWPYGTVTKGG